MKENTTRWRKTKRGLVTNLFHKMKSRHAIDFDMEFLHQFADCQKFNRLFKEWKISGHAKEFKPTIDRISNKKGYLKNNVQWLTWSENRFKQTMERRSRKGPVLQLLNDKVVNRFSSQREAAIKTGLMQGNISSVICGNRETTGGYKFIYENPELIK